MADQKRWWKLWCTAPSDELLQRIPPAHRWAWAVLGAYTKAHGDNGRVTVSETNMVLAAEMGLPCCDMIRVIQTFPHVVVEECKNRHGEFTVTWQNWVKYQEDSTQAERARASRSKRRGEENKKRGEKELLSVAPSAPENGFAVWPPEWKPLLDRIYSIPILTTYKHWLSDLSWWQTMDELFSSCPKRLDGLLLEAAAYIKTEEYRPRSKKALRLKLRNCMEFSARRAEREIQDRSREQRTN